MSRYLSEKYQSLVPYVPGEQPRDMKYVKLNTNESPFPPSEKAIENAQEALKRLNLYSDPESKELRKALAKQYNVDPENILCTNGSDEALLFAFMAYCDEKTPAYFADLTYGFYPVFADTCRIPYHEIPLKNDFTIDIREYDNLGGTIFIANPNAPTGIALKSEEIEKVIDSNSDHIVVVDEAYVDFGAESCVPLTKKYENLLVVQTFSKSRSLAGARLGFAIGNAKLIRDLDTIRNSTNPYNVNSATMAAGLGSLADQAYTDENCKSIIQNRAMTTEALKNMGFVMTDSSANFLFAMHPDIDGNTIYQELRKNGVLVRHFTKPRIVDYNRITIGSEEQMNVLIRAMEKILAEMGQQK